MYISYNKIGKKMLIPFRPFFIYFFFVLQCSVYTHRYPFGLYTGSLFSVTGALNFYVVFFSRLATAETRISFCWINLVIGFINCFPQMHHINFGYFCRILEENLIPILLYYAGGNRVLFVNVDCTNKFSACYDENRNQCRQKKLMSAKN